MIAFVEAQAHQANPRRQKSGCRSGEGPMCEEAEKRTLDA